MMNETGLHRILPDQSLGSGHSFGTPRHPNVIEPILSKRVCFYKSGDPQFGGLRMVINNRTFKTFDALLDSLSKKVPLPFGVRNITTPRGVHAICALDELEDGKSYICSDSRKVKPINLTLARKKLPPWYHARPISSRRRTVKQAKFFPGQNIRRPVVRTPKRLLVFRNGIPTVKYTVLIHKRTTPTYESVLEYISEVIQFHVMKLHTPDGRRVDGLPGLILCSGIVVAAGREPFKPANYNAQISPGAAMMPTNQMGLRGRNAHSRKKKSTSYTSPSRKFSPSSERYIVNRIHDSIAESSHNPPSNPTNSVEFGSCRVLESVVETEGEDDGAAEEECLLPTDDDIEKSFRVNQDGSMTVEMRVRLTIKEEETVRWTTTLTRSSVTSPLNGSCLPEPEAEQEISALKSNSLDLESPTASIDITSEDNTGDINYKEPPSLGNGAFSESSNEEDNIREQASQRRAPTPGHKQVRTKQTSVESMTSVTAEGIQEDMIGAYTYREQTEHGAMTEQYCMVKQSSTKPVPKPRRLESVNSTNTNSRNVSAYKSAGLTEVLQTESSSEDVTETVLHIYEQQTCQDNFHANIYAPGSGIPFHRPATSGPGQFSSNHEHEPHFCRPSTASEPIDIWINQIMAETSDSTFKTGAFQATNDLKPNPQQSEVKKSKMVSSKSKVVDKRVRQLVSPGRRQKENSSQATEKRKKVKTFSSAGFIKKIYGNKSKSAKSPKKLKKGTTQSGNEGVTTKSSTKMDDTLKHSIKDSDTPSAPEENPSEKVYVEKNTHNGAPSKESQPQEMQAQTSRHQENKSTNKAHDISESMALPAFNSSTSVTNEYVEFWLEKSHLNPTADPCEESEKIEAVTLVQTANSRPGESEIQNSSVIVAKEVECLEETSETQTRQTLKSELLWHNLQGASVKDRIRSFENKSSNQSVEKIAMNHQIAQSQATSTNTGSCTSVAQNHEEELKPLSNHCCPEIISRNDTSAEMPSDGENKSSPTKISLKDTTPSNSLELPFPPPPAETMEMSNSEHRMMDVSSVVSSPLYRLSSESSQMSDDHPSDKATSPTDHTMGMTTSVQTGVPSTLEEAPLQRTASIKRAPLVSNVSLDRKMSQRKARMDKYTLCSAVTSETATSSIIVNVGGDNVLLDTISSTTSPTQTPPEESSHTDLKNSPSCCSSAYPTSLTSEERTSSVSVSSNEAPKTKTHKAPISSQKESSSPKLSVHKVKHISSPSLERRSQTKKLSSEPPHNSPKLSSIHKHGPDKTVSPNIGIRKHANSAETKSTKAKLQKTASPYSQSLDVSSPPMRHKSSRKMLSRNLSSDNASESKTSSERKPHQTPQSTQSAAELLKTLTCKTEADRSNEPNDEYICEESQLHGKVLFVENEEAMQPCRDAYQEDEQQDHDESISNRESMNAVVRCTSKVEGKDMAGNLLQRNSEGEEGQNISCPNKGVEQKMSCEQKISNSEGSEQHSSQEEPEVECERAQQESRESDFMSNPENQSEEEEDKQPRPCDYAELNVRRKGRMSIPESQNKSEEEKPEVDCSPSNSENEQQSRAGLNVGVDENPSSSAVDEPSSEEERVECEELTGIVGEHFSGNEDRQESIEERQHLQDPSDEANKCYVFHALKEETEEVSSADDEHNAEETHIRDDNPSHNTAQGDSSYLVENQDNISSIRSDILAKPCRFSADSGNHHSSCEDHEDAERQKDEDGRISSSVEEELSYYDKESSSDEEHADVDRYVEGSCVEYKDTSSSEGENCEKAVEEVEHPCVEKISQSIAERVSLLEKRVADAQNRKKTTVCSPTRRFPQRNAHLGSDGEDSELPMSESAGTRSAPQSSLSFSYDSSGVITTEPEGNRVRSIRDMFLAKSATDIQHGRFPSPNTELSELRAETSVSGGYQSQTSSDLSGGEDDSARKSITKGFVRRTIERLYGKKDPNPDEDTIKRPPSVPKQKTNEHSNIFSPFHAARSKAMSELSYFSSTNALDTLGEATRCVAFNAQVSPGDSVPVQNRQCALRENTMIRKSLSDPAGINKAFTHSRQGEGMCEDTEEKTSHSLVGTRPEQEDESQSFSRKCTYFSLPHAYDSDVCQDDLNTATKSSTDGDAITETKDESGDAKVRAERNGKLPGVGITEFKMMDNKVHPLIELPPDGEVVVAQPMRGQGALNRRLTEPDILDLMYNFCGENCPIL